jgi:hypothetical protein
LTKDGTVDRHLNLVEQNVPDIEKRVFPRFPFCYLVFKPDQADLCFEVVDISHTGLQLSLKDGSHRYKNQDLITGEVHWRGRVLSIKARVRWVRGSRLGLSFIQDEDQSLLVTQFLSIEKVVKSMRSVHKADFGIEMPSNLKYWLQADGPVELFVWRHKDGEVSRIHFILFDEFIEWEDGIGLRTGRVIQKRDMDTPLLSEDEFLFEIDQQIDGVKLGFGRSVVNALTTDHLPQDALDFLTLKLG